MRIIPNTGSSSHRLCGTAVLLSALLALGASAANAASFPVSGTLTVNGNGGALPAGGSFGNSSYDTVTGILVAGVFTFPESTLSFTSQVGPVVVTYLLSQTNTASGQVGTDGVAALSDTVLKLQVISATVSGFPIDVGTCVFQPIDLPNLAGTGAATGLDLTEQGFVIPPVGANDCGGNGGQINNAIAGSNNSIQLHLAGNFTPPANDTIFANGFD